MPLPMLNRRRARDKPSPGPQPGLWEQAMAAGRSAFDETEMAQLDRLHEAYAPVVEALAEAEGKSVSAYWTGSFGGGEVDIGGLMNRDWARPVDYAKVEAGIARVRQRNPKAFADYGTRAEFEKRVLRRNGGTDADEALLARGSGWKSTAAQFAGGAIGGSLTPEDLALGVATGGIGRGLGLVRGALASGTVNAAGELAMTPQRQRAARAIGRETNVALNVGGAFVFGAGVHVGAKGAARGIDAMRGGFERQVAANWDRLPEGLRQRWAARAELPEAQQDLLLADISEAVIGRERMSGGERAAANVLRREAEIDAANPFRADGAGTAAHRQRLSTATSRLLGGTAVRAQAPVTPARFDLGRFMQRNRVAESGGNDAARAATSSAYGRYQFLQSTWLDTYRQTFGNTGESAAAILAKRADGAVQDRVMQTFTMNNVRTLRHAGVQVDDGAVYLAHFLGPADAIRVLKAAPDAPVGSVVRPASVNANRAVFDRIGSASELVAWARRKMGRATPEGVPARAGGEAFDPAGDPILMARAAQDAAAADRAAAEAELGRLAMVERGADEADGFEAPPLPQLDRAGFDSDSEWRIAQARLDADALGLAEPAVTRASLWAEARDRLLADKAGEVRGALYHPQVGAIDVKWGDAKGGLAKIIEKHSEVLDALPDLIDQMGVKSRSENRIVLQSLDHRAVVRLDWDGDAQHWLLSAYQVKGKAPSPADYRGAGDAGRDRSPAAGAGQALSPEARELQVAHLGVVASERARMDALDAARQQVGQGADGRSFPGGEYQRQANALGLHPLTEAEIAARRVELDDMEARALDPAHLEAQAAMMRDVGHVPPDPVLARFDDPEGPEVAAQIEGLAHDVKAALDAGELDGLTFHAGAEGEAKSAAELLGKLDADEAALKALRGCL